MAIDLGKTASITLLTGLPGAFKTCRLVHFIKQAHEAGELVYVCNLNGLKIPHQPFANPRAWRDLPAGSVLVVDEAQEFFRSRRGGEPPTYLTDMERIRHFGVRLIIATQQPDYLDAHLRGLVGSHEHLVRENGKESTKIYRHNEVMDNVRSERGRARYDSEVWSPDKAIFDAYTSAQVHTMKRTIPSKVKRGMVIAAAALVLIGIAFYRFPTLTDFGQAKAGEGAEATAAQAAAAPRSTRPSSGSPVDRETWAELRTPRVAALPASAPIYDDMQVQDYPRAYCMASGEAPNESCTCMTQQGTKVRIPRDVCIYTAYHGGDFDPYKQPPDLRNVDPVPYDAGVKGGTPSVMVPAEAGTAPGPIGVGDPMNLQQGYGGMRGRGASPN